MPIAFNADEILQMAERIERNGVKFYSLAAGRLKAFRDIFLQLARQEEEHLAIFSGMKQVVPEKLGGEKMNLIIREEFRHISILRAIIIKH